jgi:hypothetical protein
MGVKNGHGGTRPGAGRKPKVLLHMATAAAVESKIADALPRIIDQLITAAEGGDVAAARYLCDRLLGRVPALATVPAEDTRLPYEEPDAATAAVEAEIAAAQARSDLELRRLLAGVGRT